MKRVAMFLFGVAFGIVVGAVIYAVFTPDIAARPVRVLTNLVEPTAAWASEPDCTSNRHLDECNDFCPVTTTTVEDPTTTTLDPVPPCTECENNIINNINLVRRDIKHFCTEKPETYNCASVTDIKNMLYHFRLKGPCHFTRKGLKCRNRYFIFIDP